MTSDRRLHLAPLDLRVAGDGYNPTYGTSGDIEADWDLSCYRSSDDPVTKALTPEVDQTVLEVLTVGDVLAGTFEFTGGAGPRTITNAQLVAALGSETDFKLRAWFARSGYYTTPKRMRSARRQMRPNRGRAVDMRSRVGRIREGGRSLNYDEVTVRRV